MLPRGQMEKPDNVTRGDRAAQNIDWIDPALAGELIMRRRPHQMYLTCLLPCMML